MKGEFVTKPPGILGAGTATNLRWRSNRSPGNHQADRVPHPDSFHGLRLSARGPGLPDRSRLYSGRGGVAAVPSVGAAAGRADSVRCTSGTPAEMDRLR